MQVGVPTVIQRTDIRVRYVEAADVPSAIQAAWPALEGALGSLRGRRFLGVFDPQAGWYRASVESRSDAGAAEELLPVFVVPGGCFVRVRLRGEPPRVYGEIPAAYELLESTAARDDTRPSIESYRRHDEIDILMPVL
jgi:hypothetical protein